MGAPITWQNVGEPSGARTAAPILQGGVDGVNAAFGIFSKLIQQKQGLDQANAAAVDDANKQVYLDRLASAKTPEELAALQASGQLDTMRQGLTAASRGAVRGADEARTTAVRQNDLAANTFNEALLTRAEKPILDKYNTLIASGDKAGAAAWQAQNPQVRDWSGALNSGRATTLAIAKNVNDLADAQFTTITTPQRQANALYDLNEPGRQRQLDTVQNTFLANHQTSSQAIKDGIEAGVSTFPGAALLPRNSDGSLATDRLTTDVTKALNAHLNSKGLPTLDSLGNDTAAAARLRQELIKAGAKPSDLAAREGAITTSVNTSTPAPIGKELTDAQRTLRGLQAEESAVNDQFGTVTNQGNKAALLKTGVETLKGLAISPTGGGLERYTRGLSTWLDKGGIELKDSNGKPTGERVLPSDQQLALLLSKVRTGWFYNSQSDVTDLLDEWAKSSEAQDGARKVIAIRDRNRLLGIDPLTKR